MGKEKQHLLREVARVISQIPDEEILKIDPEAISRLSLASRNRDKLRDSRRVSTKGTGVLRLASATN